MFDYVCKKFVALKLSYALDFLKAMSIGDKIVIFQYGKSAVILLDVNKDKWSEESCELTEDLRAFECVKIPQYLNSLKNE